MIPPGSTIGIIGGGQLGRMLAVAAAQLGYRMPYLRSRTSILRRPMSRPVSRAPHSTTSPRSRELAGSVDVATYEFENLPVAPLDVLGSKLCPSTRSLADRPGPRPREGLHRRHRRAGRAVAHGSSLEEVRSGRRGSRHCPLVLKTRRYGYDGKGQALDPRTGGADAAWAAIGERAGGRRSRRRLRRASFR